MLVVMATYQRMAYAHTHEHVFICTLARPIGVWNSSAVSSLVYARLKKVSQASLLAVCYQAHLTSEDWLLSHVV